MKFQFEEKFAPFQSIIETARDEHGRFFRARIEQDESSEAPWENSDMHGSVSQWYPSRDKSPGERILCSDRGMVRFYDFEETMKRAKREGWGCEHEAHTTKGERAACAVEADFKYLRDWCENNWWYVGVIISLHQDCYEEDGTLYESGVVELADHLASVWGIESNAIDYLNETASELLAEALQDSHAHRCITKV